MNNKGNMGISPNKWLAGFLGIFILFVIVGALFGPTVAAGTSLNGSIVEAGGDPTIAAFFTGGGALWTILIISLFVGVLGAIGIYKSRK